MREGEMISKKEEAIYSLLALIISSAIVGMCMGIADLYVKTHQPDRYSEVSR